MLYSLKTDLDINNVVIKKTTMGSVSILFSKKKPLIIENDSEINVLSLGYTKEDILKSNLEQLLKKRVIILYL